MTSAHDPEPAAAGRGKPKPGRRPGAQLTEPLRLVALMLVVAGLGVGVYYVGRGSSGRSFRPVPTAAPSVAATGAVPHPEVAPEASLARFARQVESLPEFQAKHPGTTGIAAQQLGLELATDGLIRTPDRILVKRAELMHEYYTREKDLRACAGMARNDAVVTRAGQQVTPLYALLSVLSASSVDQFIEVLLTGAQAELRGTPVPPSPSAAAVGGAVEALFGSLPQADATKARRILSNLGAATDADLCWATGAYYGGLLKTPEVHRNVMARAILGRQ